MALSLDLTIRSVQHVRLVRNKFPRPYLFQKLTEVFHVKAQLSGFQHFLLGRFELSVGIFI